MSGALSEVIASALGGGIRGLTRIDKPDGQGDSLRFVWTSSVENPGCLYRLDPNGSGDYNIHKEACIADAAGYSNQRVREIFISGALIQISGQHTSQPGYSSPGLK